MNTPHEYHTHTNDSISNSACGGRRPYTPQYAAYLGAILSEEHTILQRTLVEDSLLLIAAGTDSVWRAKALRTTIHCALNHTQTVGG